MKSSHYFRHLLTLVCIVEVIKRNTCTFHTRRTQQQLCEFNNSIFNKAENIDYFHSFADEKTVDRIYADELTVVDFENKYRFRKPLIVTFRNGLNDWTNSERWELNSLIRDFGWITVLEGNSREIVRHGGSGYTEVTLEKYLRRAVAASLYGQRGESNGFNVTKQVTKQEKTRRTRVGVTYDKEEPSYVFDRSLCTETGLVDTLHLPAYIPVDVCILFVGGSGTGVSYHKHSDSWNAVITGRKRWFMYPVSRAPPGGIDHGYTHTEWLRDIYPHLPAKDTPLEFVQYATEILYIPESMYHMTINLDLTVAIGFQSRHPVTELEGLFAKHAEIEHSDDSRSLTPALHALLSLRRLLPDNTEVMFKLAAIHQRLSQFTRALELLELALERDSHFAVALIARCLLYKEIGNMGRAGACLKQARNLVPNLWDVYAMSGDFYLSNDEPYRARDMYKQGAELAPEIAHFGTMLQHAQKIIEGTV